MSQQWQLRRCRRDHPYLCSLIIARAVPPSLRAPKLGKRPAGRHLVGSGGRSVLRDAQRLDLAHHVVSICTQSVSTVLDLQRPWLCNYSVQTILISWNARLWNAAVLRQYKADAADANGLYVFLTTHCILNHTARTSVVEVNAA